MALGPFVTYVPPGVYTRTLTEANAANLVAGLRIPVYIGVGQEELEQLNYELIRGSSSTQDQQIVSEDVSQRFVVDDTNPAFPVLGANTGLLTKFRVRNFPIVDGQGFGRTSNNIRTVSVTVNGAPVAVGSVQGANGYVTLQIPPQPNDDVRVTYYFHRSDTAFTDTVSDQVTFEQAILTTPAFAPFAIVAGTTDVFDLKVDGTASSLTFAAGDYTASGLKSVIDAAAITGLATSVFTDNQGRDHVRFTGARSLEISAGSANGALGFTAGTATNRNKEFRVFQRPIVDGTDGGITTTDPSKVVVKVNGAQVVATAVDGTNGVVTLPFAPAAGSTVTIAYEANTWQDTFDYLPNTLVTEVLRAGFAPNRNDYIVEQDFVVSNPSPDVSIIHWGSSFVVASAQASAGSELFDDTQIIPTLVDDKIFLAECERVVNTLVIPAISSPNQFLLPEVPTTGNGRDTPLGSSVFSAVTNNRIGLNTNRPDLVVVYAGRTVQDATSRNPLTVRSVDSTTRVIVLREEVPPDQNLYATFWFSRLRDDTYIFTNKAAGAVGVGQFEVFSTLEQKNLLQVRFGSKTSLPETIQWPRGVETIPDAYHTGAGTPVSENVTVTFAAGVTRNAVFTNQGPAPYSFFTSASNTWRTTVNGNVYTTNLNTAVRGYLVSARTPTSGTNQITIPASPNNVLNLTIDGVAAAATGTIATVAGASLLDGETFTIDDGVNTPTVFEFDSNAAVTLGNITVTFTGGDTTTQVRDAIIAAVNGVGAGLTITASPGGAAQVILTNDNPGIAGNERILDTVANAGFVTVGMTGGDGQVSIPLTAGARTPTEIIGDINATLDGVSPFIGTAPNSMASFVQVGGVNGDVFFIIRSYTTPAALPDGFDHRSSIAVRQGTVESTLGFATFQSATGTSTATNKPATILGSEVGPFAIVAGVNDELEIRVDGIDYSITLTAGAARTAANIVTDIVGVPGLTGVGSVGTLGNLNKVRLTSQTLNEISSLRILGGTANAVLGYTEGDSVNATGVTAQEVVNELLATASFTTDGVAYVSEINGDEYVTIQSDTNGTGSSIAFGSGATSAFNETTGTEIVAGVSGDVGEAATDTYVVTSSNPNGSSGTGYPGQTYTDDVTGLRFTILPASTGNYTPAGSFTMAISPTFLVHPARPWLSIGGIEMIVTDTVDVGLNDTATLQTFDPGGLEPAIGDSYFVSYKFAKQDYSTRLFQTLKTIEANFGQLSAENRVTLAANLAILNGAVLIAIKQVRKVPNTNQASDQTFFTAISELATPLPGNVKPDVLIPLTSTTPVFQYLLQHCEVQSSIRNQSERMGVIGFSSGTTPITAQTIAKSLLSNRIVAVYPDSAVVTLTDENGTPYQTLVDGSFLAAAVGAAAVSPSVDVATPYTRRNLQGFSRLPRIMDPIEANQTAVSGVTVLEDLDPLVRIKQGLTTDMSSLLSRLPTVTQIADFVQQQSRVVLDSFVGTKFLATRTNEVEVSMTGLFKSLVQAEIVGAFTGLGAEVDPDDPTVLRFESFYQPVFPLLYLVLTFNLRARI